MSIEHTTYVMGMAFHLMYMLANYNLPTTCTRSFLIKLTKVHFYHKMKVAHLLAKIGKTVQLQNF